MDCSNEAGSSVPQVPKSSLPKPIIPLQFDGLDNISKLVQEHYTIVSYFLQFLFLISTLLLDNVLLLRYIWHVSLLLFLRRMGEQLRMSFAQDELRESLSLRNDRNFLPRD
jgi:hypothetical protein